MKQLVRINTSAFRNFELPVIRLDAEGILMSANPAAEALLQMKAEEVGHVRRLYPDEKAWEQVSVEMRERLRGLASAYRTEFTRPLTGELIPVSIFGVPEVDTSGKVVGSIGLVRDLREAEAAQQMHAAIAREHSAEAMLSAVAENLAKVIPFDDFRVTAISLDRQYLRPMYSNNDRGAGSQPYRWWIIPPYVAPMIEDDVPKTFDVDELFSRPDFARQLRTDPATKAWHDLGYKEILSLPVKQGNRVVAFLGLDSRDPAAYNQTHLELCNRLPLAEAILMAMRFEEMKRLENSLGLIRALGEASDEVARAAQVLVDRLARDFEWEHVSIFQFDEETRVFTVLSQASMEGFRVPDDFALPPEKGLIRAAFKSQQTVNAGNVRSAQFADLYFEGVPGITSELCLPVPGARSRWVLNIESKLENAFAKEEIDTIEMLVREAGIILERAALLEIRKAVLESISDAVVETDRRGVIREANPASGRLVGCRPTDLVGVPLDSLIEGPDTTAAVTAPEPFRLREAVLLRRNGQRVPIQVSSALMPPGLGGKVFVLSDMTYQKELHRLDLITEVFHQAALESRVPLAIAATYLSDLVHQGTTDQTVVQRILKQLRKVDIPLERLLRLAASEKCDSEVKREVDLKQVLETALTELPEAETSHVELRTHADQTMVRAPRETLTFCIESMLSFALRTRPLDRKVHVLLDTANGCVRVAIAGDWYPVLDSSDSADIANRWRRKTIVDLTLGREIIRDYARRAGGEFKGALESGTALDLRLELPLSGTQVAS